MSWQTVAICMVHWIDEEGSRQPVRTRNMPTEPCYRCGTASNIYVRRDVEQQPTKKEE